MLESITTTDSNNKGVKLCLGGESLWLPVYVMKGVIIINFQLYADGDFDADMAMLDAFVEDQGVFSEAVVQILEKYKVIVSRKLGREQDLRSEALVLQVDAETNVVYDYLNLWYLTKKLRLNLACFFSCFDPISLPQDANIPFEIRSPLSVQSVKQSLLASFESSAALLSETSGLKSPPKNFQGKIMKESILDKFKQTAASLQVELLILLVSMDFHDHMSMLEESCSVFGALERLFVDYEPFKEKVMKYIGSAELLARVEFYNRKRLELEVVSHGHAQTISDLEASNQHLRYLEREASCLKDMLCHVDDELELCINDLTLYFSTRCESHERHKYPES
ncbi:hypothetical protein RHSIM_Rhsim04G0137500 [Rhododendron simsii]|uniref:Uncharacterized protein n=1 Tax=Rhododendron simsii TaxID=118357 RepID=A0A834LRI5_RHOSS|nr:hypothetical protein RHSIM_Rhsim04G0137500 [Rhododendron simsii]